MHAGGSMLAEIMEQVLGHVTVGATGLVLEEVFDTEITKRSLGSAFKGYRSYPSHLCVGVNEVIVHGIPTDNPFNLGDVLTVDMGIVYQSYFLDMTRTVIVGKDIHHHQPFVNAGYQAVQAAVAQAKVGNTIGHIGAALQRVIEQEYQYCVSRSFVGHGIGRSLHEDPYVPGYGKPGEGSVMYEGQTLAIEIIYVNDSTDEYIVEADGWTTRTVNGAIAAVVEDTVLVGKSGGKILTTRGQ